LTDRIPEIPKQVTQQNMHDWIYATKLALQDYISETSIYNCQLSRKLGRITCPSVSLSLDTFKVEADQVREQLLLIMLELMLSCMCRAFQPPCPDPVTDDCVPLAVVTVQNNDTCSIRSICNWTTLRQYAMTAPNIQYWLSIFPLGRMLREALENFCCKAVAQYTNTPLNEGAPSIAFRASESTVTRSKSFVQMALNALSSYESSLDAESLMLGLLGEPSQGKQEYLTKEQSDNVMQFLVMDQMLKPMMRSIAPANLGNVAALGNLATMFTASSTSTSDWEARFETLNETVQKQQEMIDKLTTQLKTQDRTNTRSRTRKSTSKKKNG
jgi:hypothetical protein